MKTRFLNKEITSWVAIVIIAAFGAFFVYFIWASANESWGYDYVYPSFNKRVTKLITRVETVGWKTYRDDGYGFQLRHPQKYSETVSTIVSNSILGLPGTTVGPLVFIKADTANLKQIASEKFNYYWNYKERNESPTNYCSKSIVDNKDLSIKVVSCVVGSKKTNYALIKGTSFDIFVDGSTSGYDSKLIKKYGSAGETVSKEELVQILSTFEFTK